MKYQYVLLVAFVLISSAMALTNKTAETNSTHNVTYHEMFRPGYHFSAPRYWMNDPVGLVYFHGVYHLYYQYNPYGNDWGNMSWGHAVSIDLVYWENLPVAIYPYDDVVIFSGSTIVDVNNTSGFCQYPALGCLVAFYTAHIDFVNGSSSEAQSCAYSNDFGVSYTQYTQNPLINDTLDFHRDPKVFWYEPDAKWVMITAIPMEFKTRLYTSTDLKNWTHLSDFGPLGSLSGGWEDPDLFTLAIDDDPNNKTWILSHAVAVNQVEYYIGNFDGTTFTESDNATLFIDDGRDFDEAATWNNEPKGRRLMMAWLDEGQYGGQLPEKGWRGQQTLVRELKLKSFPEGLRIVQSPPDDITKLRYSPAHYQNLQVNSTQNVTLDIRGTQMEIIVEFAVADNSTDGPEEFGINVFQGKDQITTVGYLPKEQMLYTNRTDSGLVDFDPTFSGISNQTLTPVNGIIKLRIFVDACSIEVFANDGRVAMSNLIFPDPTQDQVSLYALGGNVTVPSLDTYYLKGIWPNNTVVETKTHEEFLSAFSYNHLFNNGVEELSI